MYSISPNIDNSKIFLVDKSELAYRLDPNYLKIKKEIVDNFKYPLERIGLSFIIKDGDHDKLPENAVSNKENGKRYLRAQDLKNDRIIDEKPIYITEEYFNKIKRCHIYPGDLLLSIMASIGAASIVPENFPISTANRAIGILRKKPNSKFLTEYVQVLINTDVGLSLFEIEKKGGIQQRLNLSDISNVRLPCPSFEIQNKIVDIYKQASQTKKKKKEEAKLLLESIDKYLLAELGIVLPERDNSYSNRVFEINSSLLSGDRWDVLYQKSELKIYKEALQKSTFSTKKLSEIADVDWGNTSITKASYVQNGFLAYSAAGQDGYLPFYDNEEDAIILSAIGARCGKCFLNKNSNWIAIKNTITIIPKIKLNIDYLYSVLNFEEFWEKSGGAQPFITSTSARNRKVPFPEINVQNRIANHITTATEKAKQLELEAKSVLKEAKSKIEKMIIG